MESMGLTLFGDIFRGKRVLVTGHTGFKGSWLCIWLKELGADIVGYALEPYTERDNFVVSGLKDKIYHVIGDVRDYQKLTKVFEKYQPEFVFHLAAQPIVRESYIKPKDTYDINIGGTVNVLECCRLIDSVRIIINITSDKCYENREWVWGYRENDPVGGYDPYSSSKGCSELVTTAYRNSFFNPNDFEKHKKALSSVRAGNVIGGGDWQKDRIIPDCIRALENNQPIKIRNPNATRPWQHVLDPLSGYLFLAQRLLEDPSRFSGAWNFGPTEIRHINVVELAERFVDAWGNGRIELDQSDRYTPHEARLLQLSIDKVAHELNWIPVLDSSTALDWTIDWYKAWRRDKKDLRDISLKQIHAYVEAASGENVQWMK